MTIDPALLTAGTPVAALPPDAIIVTWTHIYTVAAVSTLAGILGGAAIMYLRLYLNGDLVGREPHFQRRRRSRSDPGDCTETDDQEQEV